MRDLPIPAKSRKGESFKNGKLYHFDARRILVAKPWPQMRAWYKTAKLPWQPTRRVDFIMDEMFPRGAPLPSEVNRANREYCIGQWKVLLDPEQKEWRESNEGRQCIQQMEQSDAQWGRISDRRHLVLAQFYDAIPDAVREFVLRYNRRRWHLLALFARCPGAFELAQSNPALAFALASNWAFHQPAVCQPLRAARALVAKKQRCIMAWLGFPGTEQARKIMAKIPPEEIYSLETLFNLRRMMNHPESLKLLSHAPVITHAMLVFLNESQARPCLTPLFIADMATHRLVRRQPFVPADGRWPDLFGYFADILRMQAQCGVVRLRAWRTAAELRITHDALVEEYNEMIKAASSLPFPPPPYPGKAGLIEPVTSFHDLQEEGREMKHCAGSYAYDVQRGACYVYRVLWPVRATLSLHRSSHGWELEQMRGIANMEISKDVVKKIYLELTCAQSTDHSDFLKMFGADIFFDERQKHCESARLYVATGHVPHGVAND